MLKALARCCPGRSASSFVGVVPGIQAEVEKEDEDDEDWWSGSKDVFESKFGPVDPGGILEATLPSRLA